jgi:site-specific DNA recombinase
VSRAALRTSASTNGHPDAVKGPTQVRCAIYVRKSTEVDEEQRFNSLDAQRLACEEYVRTRGGEKWAVLPEQYTDGGWSGATVKRPAFQHLLADIEARRVDCVVVHRVDRLSRSLLDFARLMAFFQEHGVSFVSVTQNFSTADPVGRLTLNLLATFSEFEREMIVARTRDKVAAARRKGRWTGGTPVLGYDLDPRGGRILVNESEAARVREIFGLYLETRSLTRVVEELATRGWAKKEWTKRDGLLRGGARFDKPSLFRLLRNPLYAGKVHHRGTLHPGEHVAIVDEATWSEVQVTVRRNGSAGYQGPRANHDALLKGLLFCGQCGSAMTPTYTSKGARRHRYYRCLSTIKKGAHACSTGSVPALALERQVVERIREIGRDPALVAETVEQVRRQRDELIVRIEAQRRELSRDLQARKVSLRRAKAQANGNGADPSHGDLDARIREITARMEAIPGEIKAARRITIEEDGIRSTLEAFGPVWDALWPAERAHILRSAAQRIDYQGRHQAVSISFRS